VRARRARSTGDHDGEEREDIEQGRLKGVEAAREPEDVEDCEERCRLGADSGAESTEAEEALMRLVLVEWLDSFGCSSAWTRLEAADPHPVVCRSVGWLLYDGDDCKVVVPHVVEERAGVDAQGCGDMTIPSRAVISIVDLAAQVAA
jgi:hypothetical protein